MQTKPKQHPLLNKWIHILDSDRQIHNQGIIAAVEGDQCRIQRFSFDCMGHATDLVSMTVDKVMDQRFALVYATKLDFHWSYFYRTWKCKGRTMADDWMWYCDVEKLHDVKEGLNNG